MNYWLLYGIICMFFAAIGMMASEHQPTGLNQLLVLLSYSIILMFVIPIIPFIAYVSKVLELDE